MFENFKAALERLKTEHQATVSTNQLLHGYKESLIKMVSDRALFPDELAALDAQKISCHLPAADVASVHREVMTELLNYLVSGPDITEADIEALGSITHALAVPLEAMPDFLLLQVKRAAVLIGIAKGVFPTLPASSLEVNLQAGEIAHLKTAVELLDERTRHEFAGRSSGISVRIARAVYYRIGGMHGTSIPISEIVTVDEGDLTLTNQRLIFVGNKRSISSAWSKVLSADTAGNGIHLAFMNRQKTMLLKYQHPEQSEFVAAIVSHYLQAD